MTWPPQPPPPPTGYGPPPGPQQGSTAIIPTLGGFLLIGGGLIALLSGLLDWFLVDEGVKGFNRQIAFTWIVPVVGFVVLVVTFLHTFVPRLPKTVLTFTWPQVVGASALFALLVVGNALVVQDHVLDWSIGIGLWLGAFAVVAMLIGGTLDLMGINPINGRSGGARTSTRGHGLRPEQSAAPGGYGAPPGYGANPGYGPPSGYGPDAGYGPATAPPIPPSPPPEGPAPGFAPPPSSWGPQR